MLQSTLFSCSQPHEAARDVPQSALRNVPSPGSTTYVFSTEFGIGCGVNSSALVLPYTHSVEFTQLILYRNFEWSYMHVASTTKRFMTLLNRVGQR